MLEPCLCEESLRIPVRYVLYYGPQKHHVVWILAALNKLSKTLAEYAAVVFMAHEGSKGAGIRCHPDGGGK